MISFDMYNTFCFRIRSQPVGGATAIRVALQIVRRFLEYGFKVINLLHQHCICNNRLQLLFITQRHWTNWTAKTQQSRSLFNPPHLSFSNLPIATVCYLRQTNYSQSFLLLCICYCFLSTTNLVSIERQIYGFR